MIYGRILYWNIVAGIDNSYYDIRTYTILKISYRSLNTTRIQRWDNVDKMKKGLQIKISICFVYRINNNKNIFKI